MKEQFKNQNFKAESLKLIESCSDIVESYLNQNLRLTLRQIYYQFISRDLFPDNRKWTWNGSKWIRDSNGTKNAEPNYKWLGSVVSDARLAGMLDWEAIEDRIRVPVIPSEWNSIQDIIDSALYSYRLPRWETQPEYIELWVEKDALAGILSPLANQYHIPLMVNRGYSSQSAMYEASKRFLQRQDEGKTLRLLYLGDFDPSGEDMVRDIAGRMIMFGVNLTVDKIALTLPQIKKYNPPPNPAKMTDPRAGGFVAEHGDSSWEVDAIEPKELRKIITKEIEISIDKDAMQNVIEKENDDKAKLTKAIKNIGGVE